MKLEINNTVYVIRRNGKYVGKNCYETEDLSKARVYRLHGHAKNSIRWRGWNDEDGWEIIPVELEVKTVESLVPKEK